MRVAEGVAYAFPKTLAEALEIQRDGGTRGRPLAGGTDLMALWAAGVPAPERVTVLRGIPELERIELDDASGTAFVGAGVTHGRIRDHEGLTRVAPGLVAACGSVGARQIQAVGTIG
ncbi:MAG: FAD binding domain-containing protein, partial [Kiritimatiellae bacterium]|nr:FAD binding domain-containing protein [Kiritimatiellia bacterium]